MKKRTFVNFPIELTQEKVRYLIDSGLFARAIKEAAGIALDLCCMKKKEP